MLLTVNRSSDLSFSSSLIGVHIEYCRLGFWLVSNLNLKEIVINLYLFRLHKILKRI